MVLDTQIFAGSAAEGGNAARAAEDLAGCLRRVAAEVRAGKGASVVEAIIPDLARIRATVSKEDWVHHLVPQCRFHELAKLCSEDPYTERALSKPRGFAGDAVMLDFLYSGAPPSETSEIGREIFKGTALCTSGLSVVDRRDRLATLIQETAARKPGARGLSIACGHLREAQVDGGAAVQEFSAFYGLDQDAQALQVVEAEQAEFGVETVKGSVREVIGERIGFEQLDLVYAAGLLDYLSDGVAGRLIKRMASFLAPGGRLVVGNFTPGNWGRLYMDVFMDWGLTYRTPEDLRAIARDSGATVGMAIERVSVDPYGNIAYLELVRA